MKKILFISHDTSRTGAPMVLLHFLKWLQTNNPMIQTDLLALDGGSLDFEFRNIVTNYYDCRQIIQPQISLFKRIFVKLKLFRDISRRRELFISQLANNQYDVIYANTIVSLPFASDLANQSINSKLVVHVHEMNAVIRLLLPQFEEYIKDVSKFITPAQTVKDNLINNWHVGADRIEVVYECATISKKEIENKNDNLFTIGASGTVHWRKGYDVFIQLARYLCKLKPKNNFKFIWVGKISNVERIIIEEDLLKLGLEEKVFFVGELEEPNERYVDFDVFLMTSREDPFPLVCLELGLLGKPIISFDKATGINEVLEDAGGFIVPYLDIEAMSEKVLEYHENSVLLKEHGYLNRELFAKFTPKEICPQYFRVIQKYLM
jgi:glycosyltransferase involved in cell wall biosynthesis